VLAHADAVAVVAHSVELDDITVMLRRVRTPDHVDSIAVAVDVIDLDSGQGALDLAGQKRLEAELRAHALDGGTERAWVTVPQDGMAERTVENDVHRRKASKNKAPTTIDPTMKIRSDKTQFGFLLIQIQTISAQKRQKQDHRAGVLIENPQLDAALIACLLNFAAAFKTSSRINHAQRLQSGIDAAPIKYCGP
jgi:hypothetical protein